MKTPSVHKLLRDKSDSKIWFSKKGSQGETTWLAVAELTILVCSLKVRVHLWLGFHLQYSTLKFTSHHSDFVKCFQTERWMKI